MKNGFTLIELLATIIILSVIVLIAIPVVNNIIIDSENKAYSETKENIKAAANLYILRNMALAPKTIGATSIVTIQTLKDEGLLKVNIFDPRTDKAITNGDVVITLNTHESFDFAYYTRNYTTSGLLLLYDGLNHGAINTVWTDLSGNNNHGSLANFNFDVTSGWTNNYLQADGVNDVAKTASFASLTNLTFELVMSRSTTNNITWTTGSNTIIIYPAGTTYVQSNSGAIANGATFTITNNTIYTLTVVYDVTTQKSLYYQNGSLVKTFTLPAASATFAFASGQNIFTNAGSTAGNFAQGKVYSTRMYNRILTSSEIYDNYKVDKDRFNF